jgi:hypothetical protein
MNSSFAAALRGRGRPIDVLALLAVPAALLAVFLLPFSVRQSLVLSYAHPTLAGAYASNFVHLSSGHLLTNLLTYCLLTGLCYACATLAGERGRFFVALAVFVGVYPFVLSAFNVALVRPRIGYGFSGVNMALLGFLPIAILGYLHEWFDPNLSIDHAGVLFFVGAGLITVLAAPAGAGTLAAEAIAFVAIGIYARSVVEDVENLSVDGLRRALRDPPGFLELPTLSVAAFCLLPLAAFPPSPIQGSGILNFYSHILGYCFGFLAPYLTFRTLNEFE